MPRRNSHAKDAQIGRVARSGPAVKIEYPREGETLTHPCYTFHIKTVPEAQGVEVSIDQSEWKPCRESLGLWWYDLAGPERGEHVVIARTRVAPDVSALSEPRRFTVG